MEPGASLSSDVRGIAADLAAAAQRVYDRWEQDEDGVDEHYGAGGICDDVASAMAEILSERLGVDGSTQYVEVDCHTVVIAAFADGVHCIDIPPFVYERGGGYVWRKIPDVVIAPDDVTVDRLSSDPDEIWRFVDGVDEPEPAPAP